MLAIVATASSASSSSFFFFFIIIYYLSGLTPSKTDLLAVENPTALPPAPRWSPPHQRLSFIDHSIIFSSSHREDISGMIDGCMCVRGEGWACACLWGHRALLCRIACLSSHCGPFLEKFQAIFEVSWLTCVFPTESVPAPA